MSSPNPVPPPPLAPRSTNCSSPEARTGVRYHKVHRRLYTHLEVRSLGRVSKHILQQRINGCLDLLRANAHKNWLTRELSPEYPRLIRGERPPKSDSSLHYLDEVDLRSDRVLNGSAGFLDHRVHRSLHLVKSIEKTLGIRSAGDGFDVEAKSHQWSSQAMREVCHRLALGNDQLAHSASHTIEAIAYCNELPRSGRFYHHAEITLSQSLGRCC